MIPGISRNWRRTSTMIAPAALPTARMARELKKYTSMAAMKAATKTLTLARLTEVIAFLDRAHARLDLASPG